MSTLGIFGLADGLASTGAILRNRPKQYVLKDAVDPSFEYRKARVGRVLAVTSYFWVLTLLVDLEAVRKTHLNINRWRDEELLTWKNSYVSGCNAIAVAVSHVIYVLDHEV